MTIFGHRYHVKIQNLKGFFLSLLLTLCFDLIKIQNFWLIDRLELKLDFFMKKNIFRLVESHRLESLRQAEARANTFLNSFSKGKSTFPNLSIIIPSFYKILSKLRLKLNLNFESILIISILLWHCQELSLSKTRNLKFLQLV